MKHLVILLCYVLYSSVSAQENETFNLNVTNDVDEVIKSTKDDRVESATVAFRDGTSGSLSVGSSIYVGTCSDNSSFTKTPYNIGHKIAEVANVVSSIKSIEQGLPVTTKAESTVSFDGMTITATLDNLRDVTIALSTGEVLAQRRVSGPTSLFEIKSNNKVVAWGVGWHKYCGTYYKNTEFTVLRIFLPTTDGDKVGIQQTVLMGAIPSQPSLNKIDGVITETVDIGSGAGGCYYCLPNFYALKKDGLSEINDPESLAKYIDIGKVFEHDFSLLITWLADKGSLPHIKLLLANDYDFIYQSFKIAQKVHYDLYYKNDLSYPNEISIKESDRPKIKSDCLKSLESITNIKELGNICFPILEYFGFFPGTHTENLSAKKAQENLYTEQVIFSKSNDPRHITFTYPDGSELHGVHVGVTFDTLMGLRDSKGDQRFNLVYSENDGLVLSHISKSIELSLVGKVENHPMDIILKDCYEKAVYEGPQRECKQDYDRLIDVEINRAYALLQKNSVDISSHKNAWKAFSSEQYKFMREFYGKFKGTKWIGKNLNDIVAIGTNHLHILNGWVEASYTNEDY